MPQTYTEDPLVEPPATRGKAEGEMLKAEMPPKSITAAGDELSRRLSALHRLWGAVNLKPN